MLDTLLLNLAYVSYVAASLFPSGLKLRVALVAQSVVFITWGVVADNRSAIAWNIVFAAVNVFQAVRSARRDAVSLNEHEEAVRATIFPGLSKRDFLQLWSAGRGDDADPGEQLCVEGTPNRDLLLLTAGELVVTTQSGLRRSRTSTCFVGEMSFLSGEAASADVIAATPISFRRWNQDDLRSLQLLNKECSQALQDAMALDVTRKLRDETATSAGSGSEPGLE